MKEKDKLFLRLKKSVEYLESIAERLKNRPEEKETVNEIHEVTSHLRELLQIEYKFGRRENAVKYISWIVKAIGLIKIFKSLIDRIDF